MARGKNINLFLLDGDAGGKIKSTIANWTGVAYKIPRTELENCKERDDLKQSGVYFLFGESGETEKPIVYIGQAGVRKSGSGILYRLQEHKRNPDKDYWTDAVVFTTSNNSLGQTEISYLENQFCNLAISAKRYEVQNGNDPTPGNLTEEKVSEMAEFIDYAEIIMGALGFKVFVPYTNTSNDDKVIQTNDNSSGDGKNFYLKRKSSKSNRVIEAKCKQTREGFVVLAGSTIEIIDSNSMPGKIGQIRHNANIDSNNILQEDILFNSPSYAAAFVVGGHANGLIEWKTASGKTIKEVENDNIESTK